MRRFIGWIGGALGGFTAYRLLRRRPRVSLESLPPESDERAEELRAKLDEIREADTPSPAEPGEPEDSVEERRRRVHQEGHAALDEMRSDDGAA
jgi:hypothetical protein